MSSVTRRSNDIPSDSVQTTAHTRTDTQGTPRRVRWLAKARGRKPSSARANGKREYDRLSAVHIPNALTMTPTTTETPRGVHPLARASSAQAPVSQLDGSTPASLMAANGTTYVTATSPTAKRTARG